MILAKVRTSPTHAPIMDPTECCLAITITATVTTEDLLVR
jgi:hypothetical protein